MISLFFITEQNSIACVYSIFLIREEVDSILIPRARLTLKRAAVNADTSVSVVECKDLGVQAQQWCSLGRMVVLFLGL